MKHLLTLLVTVYLAVTSGQAIGLPVHNPKALIYSNRVPANVRAQFVQRIVGISDSLQVDPAWLMVVINFETGGSFRANTTNRYSGAVGLIQFIPSTATRLGTTTNKLSKQNEVQQLDYVKRYFMPFAGKMHSVYDVYIVVFAPAFLGRSENTVLYSAYAKTELGKRRYRYNRSLDVDQNGRITIADVKHRIRPFLRTSNS